MENLSLKQLLTSLVVLFSVTILGVASIGYMRYESAVNASMRLYDDHLKAIVHIEAIQDTYAVNILDTMTETVKGEIAYEDAKEVLLLGQAMIRKEWNHFKQEPHDIDPEFVTLADARMIQIHGLIDDVITAIDAQNYAKVERTVFTDITPHIIALRNLFDALITYHSQKAEHYYRTLQDEIRDSRYMLIIGMGGVFIISLMLFLQMSRRITRINTRLHTQQLALKEANASLEQRIQEALQSARVQDRIIAERTQQAALGELLVNIAHHWRQPLNVLTLISQELAEEDELGELESEHLQQNLLEIQNVVFNLSNTIDTFDQFFTKNSEESFFNPAATIEHTVDILGGGFQKHQIVPKILYPKEEILLKSDAKGYGQVLYHLLTNVIEAFSNRSSDTPPELTITLTSHEGRSQLTIRDNGGGITPEVLPRIFEPYFTTRFKTSGKGLGLYVCLQIVEQDLKGTLQITSEGEYTTAVLEL